MKRFLEQAFCCEVLAENSPREVHARKLPAPERIMLRRIGISRLIDSSVHGQVRLLIALQVELRNSNPARHWRLEYRRADNSPVPFYFARKSNVDRQELHAAVIASIANAKLGVTKVRSGGRKSRAQNCSDQDRRDRRLTTYVLQLSA